MLFRICLMAVACFCEAMTFGQTQPVSAHVTPDDAPIPNSSAATLKPAVRVNGSVLTEIDVIRQMYKIFPYASQHGGFPKPLEADIRKGAIEMLVFEELLYQEAKRIKVPIAPERLNKAEAEFRNQLGPADYEQFLRVECQGSKQVLREKIRRSLLIDRMINNEVEKKSVVTDAETKAYYDKNPQQFMKPERLRIQSISIIPPPNSSTAVNNDARKRAEAAYKLAKATKSYQDFGSLAEKISDDDWRVHMGDRNFVAASALPPPILRAAQAMKPGDISNVIQLGNAYTLFRLVEHIPAGKTPYVEVKDTLRSDLQKQRRVELRAALGQKLRKNAKVEVL